MLPSLTFVRPKRRTFLGKFKLKEDNTGKMIHKCGAVHMTNVNRIYSVCDTHPKLAWVFKRRSLGYELRLH